MQVGEWGAWKELGIKPWEGRGGFSANFVHSVITNAAATRAFLSYWDLGTVILDIRDPSRPRYLGRTPSTDAAGDAHSAALAKNGKILIETHETPDGHPTLYDISNPAHPKKLSNFRLPGRVTGEGFTNGVHDPKVLGNSRLLLVVHPGRRGGGHLESAEAEAARAVSPAEDGGSRSRDV